MRARVWVRMTERSDTVDARLVGALLANVIRREAIPAESIKTSRAQYNVACRCDSSASHACDPSVHFSGVRHLPVSFGGRQRLVGAGGKAWFGIVDR